MDTISTMINILDATYDILFIANIILFSILIVLTLTKDCPNRFKDAVTPSILVLTMISLRFVNHDAIESISHAAVAIWIAIYVCRMWYKNSKNKSVDETKEKC